MKLCHRTLSYLQDGEPPPLTAVSRAQHPRTSRIWLQGTQHATPQTQPVDGSKGPTRISDMAGSRLLLSSCLGKVCEVARGGWGQVEAPFLLLSTYLCFFQTCIFKNK